MKVKRLTMQAFRGIDDLTLEFHPNVTVLIGVNGVGKSTILDALAILLSRYMEWVGASIEDLRAPQDTDINVDARGLQGMNLTIFLSPGDLYWSIHKKFGQPAQEKDVDIPRAEAHTTQRYLEKVLTQNAEVNIPLMIHYSVNRTVRDIPLEIDDEIDAGYGSKQLTAYSKALSENRTHFVGFFRWFRNREDLEAEFLRDDPVYRDQQLDAARNSFPKFLIGFSNLRVRRSPLRMTVEKQGHELIINQLSDGEKCLLAMVGDIARRLAIANPGLPDPLQGEGVVLIDEIELHLHPQWQRGILPKLTKTFPNVQFIVTTHSPQVIGEVHPDSIYILESTPEGVKALRPKSSFGRDSTSILQDLMDDPGRDLGIKEKLLELFRVIDEGDLENARKLQQQLSEEIGSDEAELVGARASIRRREILGR